MEDRKINERVFTGHLVTWINEAIRNKTTSFEYVTNDEGVKIDSGITLFPDIILFTDKLSGEVFNGWELKDPATNVEDGQMLANALLKAKKLHSSSFVTWNCRDAVIWGIRDGDYSMGGLHKLKQYPPITSITDSDEIKIPSRYLRHEAELKGRALDILHDLDTLYRNGTLRPAVDISDTIMEAVRTAYRRIVPQFAESIRKEKGSNADFRKEYDKWIIYESTTLNLLGKSSRRPEFVSHEDVLASLMFYNLVGKLIFYMNLCENISGELQEIRISSAEGIKEALELYFRKAGAIDYQAIFQPYFTDCIKYSCLEERAIFNMVDALSQFDFRMLPSDVIGNILENLVPPEEKQKFGQYYTGETLALLVAFPAVRTCNDIIFDPTSGTGTFLTSAYSILKYLNSDLSHAELLERIWGNDVSHFPAMLSVINLYKRDTSGSSNNFPRVMRNDFFNLEVGENVAFPAPDDYHRRLSFPIPLFDGICGNFPFIQQEDSPKAEMQELFKAKFGTGQSAFMHKGHFEMNERTDYFTYCLYNAFRFLKDGGVISVITSNAWLGKEYGLQFKEFLLENFHVKYVVRSKAEHWFKAPQVSTLFLVMEKTDSVASTRFVTLNFKLDDHFVKGNIERQIRQMEQLYASVDYCDDPLCGEWKKSTTYPDLYSRKDGSIDVCIIPREVLRQSLAAGDNWSQYFMSSHILDAFNDCLIPYNDTLFTPFRGERTGWDPMFIIDNIEHQHSPSDKYLMPCVTSSSELGSVKFGGKFKKRMFVCGKELAALDDDTRSWIKTFEEQSNKNGSKTIRQACGGHKPYWYSISPKRADIVTSINPYERYFFTFFEEPVAVSQRLVAFKIGRGQDVELMAALLNSVIIFLEIELKGTVRNLGVLDLNANYMKQLRYLDPDVLSAEARQRILVAFRRLSSREVLPITEELRQEDRRSFDRVILESYNLDVNMLPVIYQVLEQLVAERVSMKQK